LDAILKGYLDAVVSNPNKKLSTAWLRGYDGILNAYLGEKPEKFTWQGKEYTPMTFATDACGLNIISRAQPSMVFPAYGGITTAVILRAASALEFTTEKQANGHSRIWLIR